LTGPAPEGILDSDWPAIMKLLSMVRMIFRAVTTPRQRVLVQEIPKGRVIDIGGGGEGVIARAGGAAVVAIDKHISEIEEARGKAPGALWLVADATGLPFRSHSLDHATAFFSCMYMPAGVLQEVFRETHRVLKQGGEFWIWDAHMVPKGRVFAIRLQVRLDDARTLNTAYGVKAREQSAASVGSLLQEAGFEWAVITRRERWFFIKARSV
jgi:ubiquinone/menaquinone biosynthesis C-methylase UbiE